MRTCDWVINHFAEAGAEIFIGINIGVDLDLRMEPTIDVDIGIDLDLNLKPQVAIVHEDFSAGVMNELAVSAASGARRDV